jgi:cytochrome c-type biogenesis protein CcmH
VKRGVLAVLAAVCLAGGRAIAIDAEPPLADPAQQALYQRLIHEVRCLVCQNQTIGDSTAPLASDLRREIRRLVAEGKTEAEIESFLLERYGDFALYRPRLQATTVVLWLAPVVFVGIGAVALGRAIRRRSTMPADVDADEDSSTEGKRPA